MLGSGYFGTHSKLHKNFIIALPKLSLSILFIYLTWTLRTWCCLQILNLFSKAMIYHHGEIQKNGSAIQAFTGGPLCLVSGSVPGLLG